MKKEKRNSIIVVHEGDRELYFLEHISQFSDVRLNPQHCHGGSGTNVLNTAFKYSDYGQVTFAFFDEDFQFVAPLQIDEETLAALERRWRLSEGTLKDVKYTDLQAQNTDGRNPILIVSSPNSIEGLILRLIGISEKALRGKTTRKLKEMLDAEIATIELTEEDLNYIDVCENKIHRYLLAKAELTKDAPCYKQRLKSIDSKIDETKKQKHKIVFKRFLNTKVGRDVLIANIDQIPAVKLLLDAFGVC